MSSHDWEMLIRLLLAAFLGGIVGIERGSGDADFDCRRFDDFQ